MTIIGTAGTNQGYAGIGSVTSPNSRLHLGNNCAAVGGGERPWMREGMFVCAFRQEIYILKQSSL